MIFVQPNLQKLDALVGRLKGIQLPAEEESGASPIKWSHSLDDLANTYFAIVAICHQTTPLGERRLEGEIDGELRYGWDYLKEKWLLAAERNVGLCDPRVWSEFSPLSLAQIYEDPKYGRTLNRINERTFLFNNLGQRLLENKRQHIKDCYDDHGGLLGGDQGFLKFLNGFEAYSDPVQKKSQFFLSIVIQECGWKVQDPIFLKSVVDYHELRGHLRIGSLQVLDERLQRKIALNLPLSSDEDVHLRLAVQELNDRLAQAISATSSTLHYLLWNVFRNCCVRDPLKTHCSACGPSCALPERYKKLPIYEKKCIFSPVCDSANKPVKVLDPPYTGTFY